MKKVIVTFCAALVLFASCAKEGPDFFKGVYGYKTSGSLVCEYTDTVDSKPQRLSRIMPLAMEQGIMHVEPHGGGMVLTMSATGSDAYVFDASVSGTEITLSPIKRKVRVLVESTPESSELPSVQTVKSVDVTVRGKGYKTNGLMVLDLECEGEDFTVESLTDTVTYHITGSDVRCVANME